MGWTSSADNMQGTHLWFKTKEDAIYFAEKQGYEFFIQEPNVRTFRPKQYASNFIVRSHYEMWEKTLLIYHSAALPWTT